MKIHPDQIEGVRQQEQQKANRTESPQKAFGDVLGQEVQKSGAGNRPAGIVPPPPGLTVNPLLAPQAVSGVTPSMAEGQAIAQVEQTLDSLENYATQLKGEGAGSLRQAYAALEEFQSGVTGLKDAAQGRPELQGMVRELEVLATTEQMKFNRGDYH